MVGIPSASGVIPCGAGFCLTWRNSRLPRRCFSNSNRRRGVQQYGWMEFYGMSCVLVFFFAVVPPLEEFPDKLRAVVHRETDDPAVFPVATTGCSRLRRAYIGLYTLSLIA